MRRATLHKMEETNEHPEKPTEAVISSNDPDDHNRPRKKGMFKRALNLFKRAFKKMPTLNLILGTFCLTQIVWILWEFARPEFNLTTGLAMGGLVAVALIVLVPKWQVNQISFRSNTEKFSAENEARKTVATLVGGLAIFMSFYTAQQQLGVQQQVQFTDRYTKAIEEIAASEDSGKPKLAVRIGGLYVLEQIMNSSEGQHASILEVLCAYVRDNSLQTALKPAGELRADTRVALTILGRRNRTLEMLDARKKNWELFKNILFKGDIRQIFTTQFMPLRLDLSGSNLEEADLNQLELAGADFSGARLANCKALLSDLNRVSFRGADLSGCLISSTIDGADFTNANLQGAAISGRVTAASLQGAKIRFSVWTGAEIDHPLEMMKLKDWQFAFYSSRDLTILDLPYDHNVKLLDVVRSQTSIGPIEGRMLATTLLQQLQNALAKAQDAREQWQKNPQATDEGH